MTPDFPGYLKAIDGLERPLALVDREAFSANANWVETQTQGKGIRIGSKSIRCFALIDALLRRGSRYVGVLAYSAREAEHLMRMGVGDVVIAYPSVNAEANLAAQTIALEQKAKLTFMCDDAEHLGRLDALGRRLDCKVDIAIDIDASLDVPGLRFGVLRSPVQDKRGLSRVLDALEHHRHLSLVGLMTYEAQLSGVPETAGSALDLAIRALKRRSERAIRERRAELIEWTQARFALRFVNAGGTGCLAFSASDPTVTEVTAGSAYFAPALFDHYRDFRLQAAAFFALEVVRKANSETATCFGGGYVASGEPGKLKVPSVCYPEGAHLSPFEAAGEVQTPIVGKSARSLRIGDTVFLRHAKAGELCEHFNELHIVENGRLVGRERTYRGEGFKF